MDHGLTDQISITIFNFLKLILKIQLYVYFLSELQHFIIDMLQFSNTELKLTMTVDLIAAAESNSEIHDLEDLTI